MSNKNIVEFRCKHRHSAISHPKCYLKYLRGDAPDIQNLPKVLVFDIETSPLQAYVFHTRMWNTDVRDEQVISQWYMLCWSAKWLLDDTIMSDCLTSREATHEDDKRIIKSLWKLLDEADIVIAHNGNSFDVPNMNTRFVLHGLPPPSPYQQIDTKLVAQKQFGFTHNSLNALAKIFGLPEKKETNFELWKRCVSGDEKALSYMEEYNKGDVETLEGVYMKLRPWIKGHPNLGLYVESNEPVCPNCGSEELAWTDKYYYTQTAKYATYRCKCGAYGRARVSETPKSVRKHLIVGLAK